MQAWLGRPKPSSKVYVAKFKPNNRKAMQSLCMEFTASNLGRASLLVIPGVPAGQDFALNLALLFLSSLYNRDFFSTLLVLRLQVAWHGLLTYKSQQLATVLEAHPIVTPIVKKL